MTPLAITVAITAVIAIPVLGLIAITARREAVSRRVQAEAWNTWQTTGQVVPGWGPAWIWTTPAPAGPGPAPAPGVVRGGPDSASPDRSRTDRTSVRRPAGAHARSLGRTAGVDRDRTGNHSTPRTTPRTTSRPAATAVPGLRPVRSGPRMPGPRGPRGGGPSRSGPGRSIGLTGPGRVRVPRQRRGGGPTPPEQATT
jgi:hypothetical protein